MEQAIAERTDKSFEASIDRKKLIRDLASRQSFWLVAHMDDDVVMLLPGTQIADGQAYAACARIPNRTLALVAGESRSTMRRRHRRLPIPTQYQVSRRRFDTAIGVARRAA